MSGNNSSSDVQSPSGSTAKSPNKSTAKSSIKQEIVNKSSVQVRFITSLLVLLSMGTVALFTQYLLSSDSVLAHSLGSLIALALGFFIFEWSWFQAAALTRKKRAFFDEANILDTYQTRARTHGHLFQPDPPTPGPIVQIKEGETPNRTDSERESFNASRDAHYANEFEYSMRVTKEQEALEKANEKAEDLSAQDKKKAEQSPDSSFKVVFKEPTEDENKK